MILPLSPRDHAQLFYRVAIILQAKLPAGMLQWLGPDYAIVVELRTEELKTIKPADLFRRELVECEETEFDSAHLRALIQRRKPTQTPYIMVKANDHILELTSWERITAWKWESEIYV